MPAITIVFFMQSNLREKKLYYKITKNDLWNLYFLTNHAPDFTISWPPPPPLTSSCPRFLGGGGGFGGGGGCPIPLFGVPPPPQPDLWILLWWWVPSLMNLPSFEIFGSILMASISPQTSRMLGKTHIKKVVFLVARPLRTTKGVGRVNPPGMDH